MSWTDVFPVLSDDQIADYQLNVTGLEATLLDEWFGVERTENERIGKHLVATSLFWKNLVKAEGELPPVTRERMMNAGQFGLVSRYAPWEHYVMPLLEGARSLRERRPEIVFRVYLAADLEFLVEDLVAVGCEVKVMKGSSIRHNPGALWRFLALEEKGRWVTITDSDRAKEVLSDIERTESVMAAGLGLWRVPYIFGSVENDNHPGYYRPINACQFGASGGQPVELLLRAFLWHTIRGTMPDKCWLSPTKGKRSQLEIHGTEWPSYGFDEWFLTAALYPRFAFEGVLTFLPINQREVNHWLALDIEYVTWASGKSEILYFGVSDLLAGRRKDGTIKRPRSAILESMLAEKRFPASPGIPQEKGAQEPVTLVIARYREKLDWLLNVPEDVEVVVYNKGPELADERIRQRIQHLEDLPNQGREADTYLHHVQEFHHGGDRGWTVFCQGDPFPHSRGFLELLEHRDAWGDVQALTSGYLEDGLNPPGYFRQLETEEWVRGIPVRTDLLSAHTLRMVKWIDPGGARFIESYSRHHRLPAGWSVSGHFFESCGLTDLAQRAWRAVMVRGVYAAIFAVRNERVREVPKKQIPRMRKVACGHSSAPYVYERLWLHLFGLPFIDLSGAESDSSKIHHPSRR